MTQAQLTGTKAVPNVFGADQGVLVGEVGFTPLPRPRWQPAVQRPGRLPAGTDAGCRAGQHRGASPNRRKAFWTPRLWGLSRGRSPRNIPA